MSKRLGWPSSAFGPSFRDLGWVPAPRYLLRRHLVLSDLSNRTPGRVLEMGPGIGALLHDLAGTGWDCTGVEPSPEAFRLASEAARGTQGVTILPALTPSLGPFDCLMAFEVLEHLEDDVAALRDWVSYIRPGGRVLLSVPAHQKRWSASDFVAGHYRRYNREQFIRLAEIADCKVESVVCYGWPLANATEMMRAWRDRERLRIMDSAVHSREKKNACTLTSGIDRRTETRIYPLYANAVGAAIIGLSIRLQSLAFKSEMGTGYLLVGTK